MSDDDRQKALADVLALAGLLHALRGLTDEVEALLTDAMKIARTSGLTQVLIAEAAALSPSRVSQVITSDKTVTPKAQLRDRISRITERPGDALRSHRASFTGLMTMPPYRRRRLTPGR